MLGKSGFSTQTLTYDLLSLYRMLIVAIHEPGGESLALRAGMLVIGRQVAPSGPRATASTRIFLFSQGIDALSAKPLLQMRSMGNLSARRHLAGVWSQVHKDSKIERAFLAGRYSPADRSKLPL